ncbi:carnitine dehydratase [Rhodobacterales bacterium HKCCE2091]|nr:carnitine dehydratase [Rhodobacterales bacterium HKCCE2091]
MTLLHGLRVVVFADGLTDLGARMLSGLGANVVLAGETGERTPAQGQAWLSDLREAGPGEALATLLDGADIFLDGRRRRAAATDDPRDGRPRLIHVVANADNLRDLPVTDLTLMAASGLMTVIGEPDRPPLRLPGEQAYALTGIQVATAALMGLAARRRTGQGQRIDVSAVQSATLANYREAVMYAWTGRSGRRKGNLLVRGKSGVRQVWPCADGHVTWSMIDNPGMMRAVVAKMAEQGMAGELADVAWDAILVADTDQDVIERWQGLVAAFFAAHDKATLGRWSLDEGWGLSPIATLDEVRNSAHLAARGFWREVPDGQGGTTRLPGPLFLVHPAPGAASEEAAE